MPAVDDFNTSLSQTVDAGGIVLTWTDPTVADGIIVERSDGGGSYAAIAYVDMGVESYTDTGFTVDVEACYRLRTYTGDSMLPSTVDNVAAVNSDGYLYTTSDFQTPNASGGPTWSRVALGLSGTLYSYAVDPFSPLYVGTGSTVDCYIVTSTNIYKIEDMFNAAPTVIDLHTFAHTPASEGGRSIAASFGQFFVTESDNPWIVVLSYYDNAAGHTGTWATFSIDAGVTWSSEVQLTAHHSDVQFRRPGVYVSPRTPGLVYAAAFTSTSVGAPSDGYYSTDYGATWSAIVNPNIDPDEGMPLCIHVPWSDNADEKIVYYGSFFESAGADSLPITAHQRRRGSHHRH